MQMASAWGHANEGRHGDRPQAAGRSIHAERNFKKRRRVCRLADENLDLDLLRTSLTLLVTWTNSRVTLEWWKRGVA